MYKDIYSLVSPFLTRRKNPYPLPVGLNKCTTRILFPETSGTIISITEERDEDVDFFDWEIELFDVLFAAFFFLLPFINASVILIPL